VRRRDSAVRADPPVLDVHRREGAPSEVDGEGSERGAVEAGSPEAAVEEEGDRMRPFTLGETEIRLVRRVRAVANRDRRRRGVRRPRGELVQEAVEVEGHRANDRRWP
jgi:hypothetical protein